MLQTSFKKRESRGITHMRAAPSVFPSVIVNSGWLVTGRSCLKIILGGVMKQLVNIAFKLLFKYSCVHFQHTTAPHPIHPCLPPLNLPPLALSMCPLYMFLDGPFPIFPHYLVPPPLWLLSVCSLFQCFWLYFAYFFVS